MYKTLRLILLLLFLLPVLLVIAFLGLAFYTLQSEPLVPVKPPVNYVAIVAGKDLVKRINRQIGSAQNELVTVSISERELENLARMGAHTFDWFSAQTGFKDDSIQSQVSLRLPPNPAGEYLNVSVRANESSDGVHIDQVSIGPLTFSGRWLLPLAARVADILLGNQQASLLLAGVQGFQVEGSVAVFRVLPPPQFKAQLKQAVRELQAARYEPGEQERVVHYYDLLAKMGDNFQRTRLSLNAYLMPLMVDAAQREQQSSAVEENRAVIWALAIYFSNGAFENLLGRMVSTDRTLTRAPSSVTLAKRQDLMLHFIYSAGITLATQQGIGFAAGEFKELLDSGYGGSGFSFADLAADRAGIAFVEAATASEDSARELQQQLISHEGESAFFPGISGLAEGLSEAQFRGMYGDTQSQEYNRVVRQIDKRIEGLPVYQPLTR